MKPQPPVTKIRIAARTSSGPSGARGKTPTPVDAGGGPLSYLDRNWVPWTIIILGAFLRFLLLGIKPAHFDEGINGWFVDQMVKNGFYRYDPTNYHGPLHFYILFLSQTLFGRGVWALRLPVVLASTFCLWLFMRFEPIFGRRTCRLAALAMAVSPGFVFYGRYAIHEVWLLLFSTLFLMGILGLWKFGTRQYLWCLGMGIAGMILTKETYIIHLGCAAIALVVAYVSHLIRPAENARIARQTWDYVDVLVIFAAGAFAIVFFYSGTFFHWSGLKGLYKCFAAWFETGHAGNGHEKPWPYFLKLVARYEWPVLIGMLCSLFSLFLRDLRLRYLAIVAVGILAGYSIVRYKTPWCVISVVWPFLFLFGTAITTLPARLKSLGIVVASIALAASLSYCVWLNYYKCTTESEPYVYVQTFNDIYKLTDPLLESARRNPTYYHLVGHIIRESPYPLPWILGDFTRVGYYEKGNMPAKLDADFLLVQQDKVDQVEANLHDTYFTDPLTIRASQERSKLYLKASVFKPLFPERSPEFAGTAAR